jgi:phage shock protein PspC (stress-responsive transcriptional regulator)
MNTSCSSCGTTLPAGARFCSGCGAAVAGAYPYGFSPYPQPRLARPIFGRQFAGVCAAVARTYGWDVIFFCPIVQVVYLAGWIGIPEEPLGEFPPMVPPQQV